MARMEKIAFGIFRLNFLKTVQPVSNFNTHLITQAISIRRKLLAVFSIPFYHYKHYFSKCLCTYIVHDSYA